MRAKPFLYVCKDRTCIITHCDTTSTLPVLRLIIHKGSIMQKQSNRRTEFVSLRLTPAEKLQAMKIARKHGHRKSLSAFVRELLAHADTEHNTRAMAN